MTILFLALGGEFLAAVQVIVYAGAIMVLITGFLCQTAMGIL